MNYLYFILAFILAYLLGSLPFSVWIGKLFFGVDVREKGSGNAGTTNTFRVLGWKAGVPVFLFDVMKAWLAVNLIHFIPEEMLTEQSWYYVAGGLGITAILGHIYPVFASFRGGKGVASLLGVGIALFPLCGLTALGVFAVIFFISGYVSLASITTAISFPVLSYFVFHNTELPLIILSLAVALFIPLTHMKNISRLLKGTESRFLYKKKK
jgi:glycerol-3-phosphate acyltransferase PlsY